VQPSANPYYRRDLALVHHRGFGFHAEACALGILKLLETARQRDRLVLELGCGSGLLTKELIDAGPQGHCYRRVPGDA
jgi:ribosomal protein L11 methylase PrmA